MQQGAFGRFLDDDAGGAQLVAGIALAFQHADAQAALRGGDRAGRAGETGADDHHVEIETLRRVLHAFPPDGMTGTMHGVREPAMAAR